MTLLMTVASMRRWPADSPWAELQEGRWAWKAWEAGRIEEEFDPSLFDGSHQLAEMKRCVEVGLLCTQRDREDRRTMADVLEMLHGHKELHIPKMPSWFQEDGNSSPL
uniref:Uncharacterized protein n=1 Tax=Saccharum hybrid cultivar R570 TaxID=131158 RepID=A0A059Q0Y5_9POAL|nr:hypothetical protein SHCRBa_149_L06_F_10 [Saccharum hybrid cultivar R570]